MEAIAAALAPHGLGVLGGFATTPEDDAPPGTATLLLVGPVGAGYWPAFATSAEAADGAPDPLDRWSARVIGAAARDVGATAVFPFVGPPYAPFLRWALRSGRAWPSRLGMLIHEERGLWVSYRGALALPDALTPAPFARRAGPCEGCPAPCLTACPVEAFEPAGYAVDRCRAHLERAEGADCAGLGCRARRACPVGRDAAPGPEQAAFHMRAFRRAGSAVNS
jgi:hypothetical protein